MKKFIACALFIFALLETGCASRSYPEALSRTREILLDAVCNDDEAKQRDMSRGSELAALIAQEECSYWESQLAISGIPDPSPEWAERFAAALAEPTGYEGGTGHGFIYNMRTCALLEERILELKHAAGK